MSATAYMVMVRVMAELAVTVEWDDDRGPFDEAAAKAEAEGYVSQGDGPHQSTWEWLGPEAVGQPWQKGGPCKVVPLFAGSTTRWCDTHEGTLGVPDPDQATRCWRAEMLEERFG